MDVGIETTRLTEANYPEGVRRVFLINGESFVPLKNSDLKNLFSYAINYDLQFHTYSPLCTTW